MKKRIGIDIEKGEHNQIKSQASLLEMSIGRYLLFCHQTTTNLSSQAKVGGVCDENMQEFIDWLLDNQSFQDQIAMHAEAFLENQKAIEEALQKD
jgi:hypothetical protein